MIDYYSEIDTVNCAAGGSLGEFYSRQLPQSALVYIEEFETPFDVVVAHLKRRQTQDGIELGHSGIHAGKVSVVAAIVSVITSHTQFLGELFVVCRYDAAFAGGNNFGWTATKHLSSPEAPDRLLEITAAGSLGSIKY